MLSLGALLSHRRWRTRALESRGQAHELLACFMQPMELKHYHLKVWRNGSSHECDILISIEEFFLCSNSVINTGGHKLTSLVSK